MKYFLLFVLLLLAISGLCELLHFLHLLLCLPKNNRIYSVLVLSPGDAANQLNFACSQRKWLGRFFAEEIIAVYSEIDGDELDNCRKIAKYSGVIMCPSELLSHITECISKTKEV